MVTSLLVLATIGAVGNLLAPVALLAWGLSGGDGKAESFFHGMLAVLVLVGGVYTVIECLRALHGIDTSRWVLMWLLPAVTLTAVLLPDGTAAEGSVRRRLPDLWVPAVLAIPPALVWFGGGVG